MNLFSFVCENHNEKSFLIFLLHNKKEKQNKRKQRRKPYLKRCLRKLPELASKDHRGG